MMNFLNIKTAILGSVLLLSVTGTLQAEQEPLHRADEIERADRAFREKVRKFNIYPDKPVRNNRDAMKVGGPGSGGSGNPPKDDIPREPPGGL